VAWVAVAAAIVAAPLAGCIRPLPPRDHTLKTRTLAWPGGEHLSVETSADVRYVQGQNATVVVTGPADEIDDIVIDNGDIRYDRDHWAWGWWVFGWGGWRSREVHIVVTAPKITDAGVGGSGRLDLGRLSQDRLDLSLSGSGVIDVSGQIKSLNLSASGSGVGRLDQVQAGDMSVDMSGSGWVRTSGTANSLHLSISGSGVADMGGLTAQTVQADLSGSGSAKLSPKQSADIEVSGSGAVRLLTRPPQLSTHKSGSGAIIEPDQPG
jgi:hypothetical protein